MLRRSPWHDAYKSIAKETQRTTPNSFYAGSGRKYTLQFLSLSIMSRNQNVTSLNFKFWNSQIIFRFSVKTHWVIKCLTNLEYLLIIQTSEKLFLSSVTSFGSNCTLQLFYKINYFVNNAKHIQHILFYIDIITVYPFSSVYLDSYI